MDDLPYIYLGRPVEALKQRLTSWPSPGKPYIARSSTSTALHTLYFEEGG